MLRKRWFIVLVVLGFAAFEVGSASASGPSAKCSHPGGGAAAGCPTHSGACGQFPRAEYGVFGPTLAYGNTYWGWGYGYGYPGWGYEPFLAGYGYGLEGVPYFAQFPPVYFGYGDNMPVLKASIRSSWVSGEGPQPGMAPPAVASPPRPPLRIVNPYYVEAKADQP